MDLFRAALQRNKRKTRVALLGSQDLRPRKPPQQTQTRVEGGGLLRFARRADGPGGGLPKSEGSTLNGP